LTAPHLRAGKLGEQIAERWLQRKGLQTIRKNYRCKVGELDLIMRENNRLVIVEVRYRKSTDFGGPLNSVSTLKQQRIARTTLHFLQAAPQFKHSPLRFDVLSLVGSLDKPAIEWCQRAFDMDCLGWSTST
jgi:putative endonuclease